MHARIRTCTPKTSLILATESCFFPDAFSADLPKNTIDADKDGSKTDHTPPLFTINLFMLKAEAAAAAAEAEETRRIESSGRGRSLNLGGSGASSVPSPSALLAAASAQEAVRPTPGKRLFGSRHAQRSTASPGERGLLRDSGAEHSLPYVVDSTCLDLCMLLGLSCVYVCVCVCVCIY